MMRPALALSRAPFQPIRAPGCLCQKVRSEDAPDGPVLCADCEPFSRRLPLSPREPKCGWLWPEKSPERSTLGPARHWLAGWRFRRLSHARISKAAREGTQLRPEMALIGSLQGKSGGETVRSRHRTATSLASGGSCTSVSSQAEGRRRKISWRRVDTRGHGAAPRAHSRSSCATNKTLDMATMAYTMEELMWHYEQLQSAPDAYAKDPAIMEELRCGYSSKRCENIRTTKKGGGLHRFCEFHRRRANKNQWRVDNKRRMMRTQQSSGASMIAKVAPYSPKPTPRVVKKEEREEPMLPEPVEMKDEEDDESWLSDSDIAMLQQILFDEEEYERQGFLTMLHYDKEPVATSPTAVNEVARFKQEWVV